MTAVLSRLAAAILALLALVRGTPAPVKTPPDTELLAKLVAAEAGDEPYMAQVCFAATVVNRVREGGFPDTLRGVIFEEGAYPTAAELQSSDVSERRMRIARRAAEAALGGKDPTRGALYCDDADEYAEHGVALMYECGGLVFGR